MGKQKRSQSSMTTSQDSDIERIQEESPRGLKPPFQNDEDMAWEPLENDLWIPHRIRGSWRGGVLG
jgi:hypothetical protein